MSFNTSSSTTKAVACGFTGALIGGLIGYVFRNRKVFGSWQNCVDVVGKNASVSVNGKTYYGKKSVSVSGGQVYIDGKLQDGSYDDKGDKGDKNNNRNHVYIVSVKADKIDSLEASGDVVAHGNCGNINTSGTVKVDGYVSGDISTTGAVTVGGLVGGNISTTGAVTVGGRKLKGIGLY